MTKSYFPYSITDKTYQKKTHFSFFFFEIFNGTKTLLQVLLNSIFEGLEESIDL